MGPSLGDAVVNVNANTQPLEQGVKRIGSDGGLRKAILGSAAGNLIADGVGKILGGVVSVGKKVVDISVGKGFDRALNIDNARFKLQGLGHDAESVDAIMANALKSVEGTAFGLGEAGTAAASAVAAGVKPGEDLTRVLSLTGDAAAIMGRSFGDSGAIINKVLASNRLGMEEVNQLQDAGLPILQMLADQYGVTTDEMRKMVSEGKVGSEQFLKAIEANIGGAAKEMGGSFSGMRANMMAAFGRLGEAVIGPLMPVIQEFMGLVTEAANELKPLAAELGGALAPVLKEVLAAVLPLAKTLATTLLTALKDLVPAIGPLVTALLPVLVGIINALVPIITQAAGIIADLATQFGPILGAALEALLPLVMQVVDQVFPMLVDILGEIIPVLTEVASILLPVLVDVVSALLPALMPLIPAFLQIVKAILPLLTPLATLISALLPPLLDLVLKIVQPIIDLAVKGLLFLADIITKYVVPALTAWWGFLGKAVGKVAEFVGQVVDWFNDMRTKVIDAVGRIGPSVVENAKKIVGGIWDGIKTAWVNVSEWFSNLPSVVKGWLSGAANWLREAGENLISGLWGGMSSMLSWVKDKISGFVGEVTGFFKNLLGIKSPSTVFAEFGKDIVRGLTKGMGDEGKTVAKASRDIVKKALEASRNEIKEAKAELASLRAERDQMQASIASSLRGGLSLGDARNEEGKFTSKSIGAYVAERVAKAKKFVSRLRELRDAGLPPTFLQEIVGMGIDEGNEFAKALLSGSAKEIKNIVKDWTAFETFTDSAGKVVANATYSVGIDAQKGIIEGLKADHAELKKAAESLAKKLEKYVRDALKSKSPSKVFEDIGSDIVAGLVGPKGMGNLGVVTDAASKMALAAIPAPAAMGGFGGIGGTGGYTVNNTTVNVKVEVKGAATVEDGRRVGQGINEALRDLGMTAVTR